MRPLRCSSRDGIPRQVEVEEVVAVGLEVDALARGVGADQDAQRALGGSALKARLTSSRRSCAGDAGEDGDALVGAVGVGERLLEAPLQLAPRVLVLGEDDQAAVVPACRRSSMLRADPVDQPAHAGIRLALVPLARSPASRRPRRARPRSSSSALERAASRCRLGDRVLVRLDAAARRRPRQVSSASSAARRAPRTSAAAAPRTLRLGSPSISRFERLAMTCERRAKASIEESSRCCRPDEREPAPAPLAAPAVRKPRFAQLAVVVEHRRRASARARRPAAVESDRLDHRARETARRAVADPSSGAGP